MESTSARAQELEEADKDTAPARASHPRVSDLRHSVGEGVDRLLDESHRFKSAVRAAFEQFQLPRPARELPSSHLLPALQYFIQRLCDDLDAKAGKLVLRPVTQEDVQGVLSCDPALALGPLLTYPQFERVARGALKRVALSQGKRLGLFVIGGIVAVHMAKSAVKKIPLVGGPIGAVAAVLVPTSLLGPVVGVAGALYL